MIEVVWLVFAGCVKQPVSLETVAWPVPRNVWTTLDVPCGYVEVERRIAEGWTYREALDSLLQPVGAGRADAILGFDVTHRQELVPYSQCQELATCDASGWDHEVQVWTVQGVVVSWVGDCPL